MHGNLCGVASEGREDNNFAPHSGNTQQQTDALTPPTQEAPLAMEGPAEDPSDDAHFDPENSDSEDEGETLTQPLVNPIPELARNIRDQPLSEVDLKIQSVYGDYVRQNDGSHLDGGIRDDAI